jgi:hypothetical protein
MRNLIKALLLLIKSKGRDFCIRAYSFGYWNSNNGHPKMKIVLLINDVAAISRVESFMASTLAGIDNLSFVVTVSAHVYMAVVSEYAIDDFQNDDDDCESISMDEDDDDGCVCSSVDEDDSEESEEADTVEPEHDGAKVDCQTASVAVMHPCSNCGMRPIAASPQCFADWCTNCDNSLYYAHFSANMNGGAANAALMARVFSKNECNCDLLLEPEWSDPPSSETSCDSDGE